MIMEKLFSWVTHKRARTVTEFEKKRLKRRPHFGYRLLYWELGAIHRAASAGNVAAVEKILACGRSGVDDVDHKSRYWRVGSGAQCGKPSPQAPLLASLNTSPCLCTQVQIHVVIHVIKKIRKFPAGAAAQ